jgi:outer membrane protein TolC
MTTLSQLIGQEIASSTSLANPKVTTASNSDLARPELELFQLQKQQIDFSDKLVSKQNMPKLMGFGTGGYGNPGLNMLDNSFQPYYIVGLKLSWNVFDWNATKNKRKALQVNKSIIDNQQEVFKFNTNIELNQHQSEIDKIVAFITSDKTIIDLRKTILKTADSQLKNGVITSSAYITELTNLFEAENNLKTHEIQLLLAKANHKTTQGN